MGMGAKYRYGSYPLRGFIALLHQYSMLFRYGAAKLQNRRQREWMRNHTLMRRWGFVQVQWNGLADLAQARICLRSW